MDKTNLFLGIIVILAAIVIICYFSNNVENFYSSVSNEEYEKGNTAQKLNNIQLFDKIDDYKKNLNNIMTILGNINTNASIEESDFKTNLDKNIANIKKIKENIDSISVLLDIESLKNIDNENIKNIYKFITGTKTSIPDLVVKSLDISNNYSDLINKDIMNGDIIKIMNGNNYLKNNLTNEVNSTTDDKNNLWKIVKYKIDFKNNNFDLGKVQDNNMRRAEWFYLISMDDPTKYLIQRGGNLALYTGNMNDNMVFRESKGGSDANGNGNGQFKVYDNNLLQLELKDNTSNTPPKYISAINTRNIRDNKELDNKIKYNKKYYFFNQNNSAQRRLIYYMNNKINIEKYDFDNSVDNDTLQDEAVYSKFYEAIGINGEDVTINLKILDTISGWKWIFVSTLNNNSLKQIFDLINVVQQHMVHIENINTILQLKDIPTEKKIKILQYQSGLVNKVITNLPNIKSLINKLIDDKFDFSDTDIRSLLKFNLKKVSPLLTKYNQKKAEIGESITAIRNNALKPDEESENGDGGVTSTTGSGGYSSAASGSAGTGVISSAPKSDNIINVAYYNYNYNSRNRSETNSNSNDNSNDNTEDDDTDEVEDNDTDESSYRSISGVDGSLYTRNVNTDNAVYYNKILGEDFNACPVMASNPWGPFESGDFN